MQLLGSIYNTILYQPILNLLVGFYESISFQNFGVAIILVTIVSRIILHPLSRKSIESQKKLQELKPELDALREKYKDDKEKLYAETMQLYSRYKINPMGGCLPLLIQLPFIWALYHALREGLNPENLSTVNDMLYSFVPKLTEINPNFLWVNLTQADPLFIFPVLVAATQFIQGKIMSAKNPSMGAASQATMLMPIIFLFISISLPSGLNLYILLSSLLAVMQQIGYREFFKFEWTKELFPKSGEQTPS